MPIDDALDCPHCRSKDTHFLPGVSGSALVDYYRCGRCAHVWTIDKPERASLLVSLKPDRRRLAKAGDPSHPYRRRKTDFL